MNSAALYIKAKALGIKYPLRSYKAAQKAGIPFYALCAFLEQETAGGQNIFGHDPTIFVGAGTVTKTKYLAYRSQRNKTGKCQGVGPMQLTWAGYQDEADALGGCWVVYNNILVGAKILAQAWNKGKTSWYDVGKQYNGSTQYGLEVAAKVKKWRGRFDF